jgi:hypothetical protein
MIATLSASSMTTDAAALTRWFPRGGRAAGAVGTRDRARENALGGRGDPGPSQTPLYQRTGMGTQARRIRVVEAAIRFVGCGGELGLWRLPQPHVVRCPAVAFTSSGPLERDSCRWRSSRTLRRTFSESKAGPWWIRACSS